MRFLPSLRLSWVALSSITLFVLGSACGGGGATPPEGCVPGNIDCECHPDATCDEGLSCEGGICLTPNVGSGGTSTGGTSSGGGTSTGGTSSGGTDSVCVGTPTATCDHPLCHAIQGCEASAPATCEGTSTSCSAFDNDAAGCAAQWGCGQAENGYCYQYASRCSDAGRYDRCLSTVGCSWVDGSCVGTVRDCTTVYSGKTCKADYFCTWHDSDTAYCNGAATRCETMLPQYCELQEGCSLAPGSCSGTPTPCSELSANVCRQTPGCSLARGGGSGQPIPSGIKEPLPDLIATNFSARRTQVSGASVLTTSLRWINRGMIRAEGHSSALYLSTDEELSENDLELQTFRLLGMGPYGGYYSARNNINFPMADLARVVVPGHYYVIAKIDSLDEVVESEEQNNVSVSDSVFVGLDRYDVALSDFTLNASSYSVGATMNLGLTVTNSGTLPMPSFPLSFYLSSDAAWDPADALLCSKTPAVALAVDASRTLAETCTVPRVRGSYYVLGVADPADTNGDEDPSNNVVVSESLVTFSAPAPDLTVSAVSSSSYSPAWNQEVTLSALVTNDGADPAPTTNVGFYLSVDGTFSNDDAFICSRPVGALEAGASVNVSGACRPPSSALGAFTLIAVVDPSDAIFEAEEGNNTATAATPLTIAAPDFNLTAQSISFSPFSARIGQNVVLEMTIGNTRTQAVPAFRVNVYLSTDTNVTTTDELLCYSDRPSLAAGTATTFQISCSVPTVELGSYYVGFIADPTNTLPETNENDNRAVDSAVRITISR